MSRSDDELAKTAAVSQHALANTVASGNDNAAVDRTQTAGAVGSPREIRTLGRLRLERVLGSGGMGVVYAAFDPDLERRVAVKLLHASSADARARLLREARAMAKLSHANVITVFDVGSAEGEDFVTMELIDGETLKDWLARARPSWREIVLAFAHAGRGLAAAHDAGLVHRDFKPANVLRSTAGKLVVTDFGLSRAAGAVDAVDAAGSVSSQSGPSTKTATGAVLGTPAYMAPEQWTGGALGPAADQFAFCVALSEALAGHRPFGGETFEEIKASVLAGPGDDHAIPRPVRAIIRRGLAPDPAARWPSMTALLTALDRALARRRRLLGLAAAIAVGAAGTIGVLSRPARDAGLDCSPPALDVDRVWSSARADAIGRRDPESAKVLAADLAAWRQHRERACAAAPASRSPALACLDGVLARFDLTANAVEHGAPSPGVEGTSSLLVDPAMCSRVPTPRLTSEIDRELATAFDGLRVLRNGGKLAAPVTTKSPCARALELRTRIAALDVSTFDIAVIGGLMRDLKAADELADRCNDDAIKAQVVLGLAHGSPQGTARAEAAVTAFPQDDLLAELDLLRGEQRGADAVDLAIADFEHALERYGKRHRPRGQLRAVVAMLDVLIARSRPADLARVADLVATWRTGASNEDRSALDQRAARARWRLGDVAGADAIARDLPHVAPRIGTRVAQTPPVAMHGTVVDEAGKPIAGAEVVASNIIDSDSADAAAPLEMLASDRTRTDEHGAFAIAGAHGLAVASAGNQRSTFVRVAPTVALVVHPTVKLTGKVALGTLEPTRVRITLQAADPKVMYDEIAPVRADGSFELDHVLPGKLTIVAREYGVETGDPPTPLDVSGDLAGISLTAQLARPLHVLARNTGMTTPDLALLFVFAGHAPKQATLASLNVKPLVQFEAHAPPAELPAIVKPRLQSDDLYGALSGRPTAPIFVCTAGVTRDMFSMLKTQKALIDAFGVAELGCVDIPPDDPVVIVEIPPLRKPRVTGP
jgi:hypothetical protein